MVKKRGALTEVCWTDALNLPSDWLTPKEARRSKPALSFSVGYVVKETDEFITIASTVNDNHVTNGITIPKCCVVWQRVLEHVNPGT